MLSASERQRAGANPSEAMLRAAVLAWVIAAACVARAEEATDSAGGATDTAKLTAGAVLLSDYIYRGISSHKR